MIDPDSNSSIRKNNNAKDDFPAPVLPTTPIFSFGLILKETLFNTKGRFCLYRTQTLSKVTFLWESVRAWKQGIGTGR